MFVWAFVEEACGPVIPVEAARLLSSHDLWYNMDIFITIRNEATFSNAGAIPSIQA